MVDDGLPGISGLAYAAFREASGQTGFKPARCANSNARIDAIRAGRKKPGLLRQHLTAVRAAVAVGGAKVEGDELGSRSLTFHPGKLRGGDFRFSVGTAGSACLVLQTVLPALLHAPDTARVTIEGGTHNPSEPPFDFLARAFAPQLRRMGARLDLSLERPGFYPAGRR